MLTSVGEPSDNHLQDIAFGIKTLLCLNVPIENVTLIIDGNSSNIKSTIAKTLKTQNKTDIKTFKFVEFEKTLYDIKKEFIVLCICGHGSIEGLEGKQPIKPHPFIKTIKTACTVKRIFLLIGSCYAGIFNHLDIKLKKRFRSPEITIMGATNLTKSIGIPIGAYSNDWYANILFFAFFVSLKRQLDVDGDNKLSFMDILKHTVYLVKEICIQIEKIQRMQAIKAAQDYEKLFENIKDDDILTPDEAQEKARLDEILQTEYIHQEPWILNALSASDTYFDL